MVNGAMAPRVMTKVTMYGYRACSTCRKAAAYLQRREIAFDEIDITTSPPPRSLLQALVTSGACQMTDLLNRSGELYRVLNMKERLKTLRDAEVLDLLAAHGRLIKRPIITDGTRSTVGFDERRMRAVWG